MKNSIPKSFYENNRKQLASLLKDSLILIPANKVLQMSSDTTYPFRQDSNFWYLTGLDNPDIYLAINTNTSTSSIFIPEQNDYQREWDGEIDTVEITEKSGIKNFEALSDLEKFIESAQKDKLTICCLHPPAEVIEPYGFIASPARQKLYDRIASIAPGPKDIRNEIARLRQIKYPVEIEEIKLAIEITGKSLRVLRQNLSSYSNEKEVENSLTSLFYAYGANGHGFEPIIAGGKNAATIHYRGNNQKLENNDLLLLDVGAQSGYYSADISRTWAISTPSSRQKEIYSAVIELQQEAYNILKPGIYLKDYQTEVESIARTKMRKLKCTNPDRDFPHGISHFLGLDVHDAGDYNMPLAEGMVLTVEPGIYLEDEAIGVRIEDVVLITSSGTEILSKDIPNIL